MSKYKIFISYAHIDNQYIANQKWVDEFVKNLSANIDVTLGRKEYSEIWFDKTSLKGNARLTEEIKSRVRNSNIFVMILSEGYINSSWCIDELNAFLESNDSSEKISNIFIIQKDNLSIKRKPSRIQDILGFEFWFRDKSSQCRTYRSNHHKKKIQSKYYDLVEDVSREISGYLKNIEKQKDYEKIVNSFPLINKTKSPKNQIFLIFNQDNLMANRYEVIGHIQCEDTFENELIEFTFENIHDKIEQEEFIQKLVDEFDDGVTIHFIVPSELFLVNFKQWRYRGNELIKRYHILLHNKDRYNSKSRKYQSMIDNWQEIFEKQKDNRLRDALIMTTDNSTRFDTRWRKMGICFKQQLSSYELVNNTLDMAKVGLWQYPDGAIDDYCTWVDGNLCLKDLNLKSRDCDHVALLWDDMSLLEKLKKREL